MRYWKFDIAGLLRDYPANQNAVATLKTMLSQAKKEKSHPMIDTDRDMLARRIQQIEVKISEYQMYVDWVVLGFDVLNETERQLLEYVFIELYSQEKIKKIMEMDTKTFKTTLKQALTNFTKVVSPL